MTTERIDIVVSERGSRTVKRNLEDLAGASSRAGSATDQLRSSLTDLRPTAQLGNLVNQINNIRDAMRVGPSTPWAPVAQSQQAQRELSQVLAKIGEVRSSMASGPSSPWFPRISIRDANAELARFNEGLEQVRSRMLVRGPVSAWPRGPILEANTELGRAITNLNTVQANMRDQTPWSANYQFERANRELSEVLAKMGQIQLRQAGPTSSLYGPNLPGGSFMGQGPYQMRPLVDETSSFGRVAQDAAGGAQQLAEQLPRAGDAARGTQRQVLLLNRALGVLTTAYFGNATIQTLAEWSDAATTMANRVMLVSDNSAEAASAMASLHEIARRTRSPVEGLVDIYQKASMASTELGASQEDILNFVETVGMALAIQGGSANTARGALIQLSQAIGTDVVRAEEFNSILEGAYPLALLAAQGIDEAGGSVARLRRLVIDGKVSSQDFFRAVIEGQAKAEEMFSKTTPTITQAITIFRNNILEYIGTSETAKGITEAIANAIILVADNIEPLADLVLALGEAWVIGFALSKIANIATAATNVGLLAGAFNGLKLAMGFFGGPVVGAVALAIGGLLYLYQNAETAADRVKALDGAMTDSLDALEQYAQHVATAKKEQEELGGVVNLTTERLLQQSRAQLQDTLRNLQTEIANTEGFLDGDGIFNISKMKKSLDTLYFSGANPFYGNEEIENLYRMLEAINNGTGDIDAFVAALNRVRGVGQEVDSVVNDLNFAMGQLRANPGEQAGLWFSQAREQIVELATAIGGYEEIVNRVNNADSFADQKQALEELAAALQETQTAGAIVTGGGILGDDQLFSDLADLLTKLSDAREQERLLREALGANATSLQSLVEQSRNLVAPMSESATSTGEMGAELRGISFSPAVDGARNLADQLVRGAAAMQIIQDGSGNINVPSVTPQVITASYGNTGPVTRSNTGGLGLMELNSGGSFTVGGTGGVDQNLVAFWASRGENVLVSNDNNAPGGSLMNAYDRAGQSEEYLRVIRSINSELETQYQQLTLNTQAAQAEQIVADATAEARREGIILSQQDIALIRQRAEALSEMETKLELIQDVSNAVFSNLSSSLDSFVRTGKFSFSELAVSIIADMAKIGMQTFLLGPLQNWFQGLLGGFMGVGGAGLPAYNEGADFVVGGRGGVDQNVVAFKASRGERVTVTPVGKDGSNGQVTNNFYITTPDVQGFRQSEAQIAARMQRALGRGQRNM